MDGIEATRALVARSPSGPRVLVVTTFEHDEYVYDALRAGASGFVLKRVQPEELAQAVRIVASGESLVFPALTRRARRAARDARRPERPACAAARPADRPRGRDAAAGRARTVEPGDRRRARGRRPHGEDARRARAREARGARPHPGGRARLRDRLRPARRVALSASGSARPRGRSPSRTPTRSATAIDSFGRPWPCDPRADHRRRLAALRATGACRTP